MLQIEGMCWGGGGCSASVLGLDDGSEVLGA